MRREEYIMAVIASVAKQSTDTKYNLNRFAALLHSIITEGKQAWCFAYGKLR